MRLSKVPQASNSKPLQQLYCKAQDNTAEPREARNLDSQFADTAVAITDNEVLPQYLQITLDWLRSNPRGYAEWFKSRMGDVFLRRRESVLEEMRTNGITASVEDIPTYRVRTPLQSAIMILKRQRDTMFADDPTEKPISIIISTLSAHAYQGEETMHFQLETHINDFIAAYNYAHGLKTLQGLTPFEYICKTWTSEPDRSPSIQPTTPWDQTPRVLRWASAWIALTAADWWILSQAPERVYGCYS